MVPNLKQNPFTENQPIWWFPEIGVPPSHHPFLDGILPCKPFILGCPHSPKTRPFVLENDLQKARSGPTGKNRASDYVMVCALRPSAVAPPRLRVEAVVGCGKPKQWHVCRHTHTIAKNPCWRKFISGETLPIFGGFVTWRQFHF